MPSLGLGGQLCCSSHRPKFGVYFRPATVVQRNAVQRQAAERRMLARLSGPLATSTGSRLDRRRSLPGIFSS